MKVGYFLFLNPQAVQYFGILIVCLVSNETNAVAKVTFDYDAENDDELTLKEGDIVKVLNQEEEGWWKGELNGKIGVFPANFVELVKGSVSMTESQPVSVTPHQEPGILRQFC